MDMTRREALQRTGLVAAVAAVGAIDIKAADAAPTGPFQLPKLPYAYDALEPHIDARTMEIHHGKHHAAYVNNLNKAVAGQSNVAKNEIDLIRDLSKLPENIRTAVRNKAADAAPTGPFQLPKLPYAYDALEPHIDARTMEIHHGKHHAAYVNNLNKAVAGQSNVAKNEIDLIRDLSKLPENIRTAVRN